MNGKHNCVEKRTDWSISMELDQEKQNHSISCCPAIWCAFHTLPCGNGPFLGDEQSIFRVQCTRFLKLWFV